MQYLTSSSAFLETLQKSSFQSMSISGNFCALKKKF